MSKVETKKETKRAMTLVELQDVLGARIQKTLDDSLSPEERQTENEQSALIMNIAKQMINNADIMMRYESLQAKNKNLTSSRMDSIIGE